MSQSRDFICFVSVNEVLGVPVFLDKLGSVTFWHGFGKVIALGFVAA